MPAGGGVDPMEIPPQRVLGWGHRLPPHRTPRQPPNGSECSEVCVKWVCSLQASLSLWVPEHCLTAANNLGQNRAGDLYGKGFVPAALSACLAALPFSPTSLLIPLPLTFWVFPATSERSVNVDKYYCEEVMAKYSLHHLYALVGERFFISYIICYFSVWQFCKMRKENWRAEEPTLCSCCSHTPSTGTRRLLT